MSACNFPSLTAPQPSNLLAALVAALKALGLSIPQLPTIPWPPTPPFCPLD